MTRNGKIARLPRPLRDELNRRLSANEDGATLLDWLNAAPDAKAVLARDFVGEPISKQNLYEWRHGGLLEWQSRQDLFAAAADLTNANGEWDALAANDFTERLAAVVVVRYADALAGWNGGDDEAFRLKLRDLRHFNQDLAVLRRYNQSAARLKMEQMPFYQEETRRAEAAESARKQSAAGARAYDERLAQRRREAEAAAKVACVTPSASATSASSAPAAAVAASPANFGDQTAADLIVSAGVRSPQTDRMGLSPGDELPNRGSVGSNQVKAMPPESRVSWHRSPAADSPSKAVSPVAAATESPANQPADGQSNAVKRNAGKSMGLGAPTLASGLVRANLVVEFADSLSNALTVIKEKSVHAFELKDRRAVQSAYAGSVATVNRLGKEAGWLRAELPGFAEVERLSTALELLQQEYPRMRSNLFQGFPATITVGIQQMRNAACDLRETLQLKTATAAPQGKGR